MEIPKNKTTRLSEDVWRLAIEHAKAEGLGSPREAIERMVRLSQRTRVQSGASPLPISTPQAAPQIVGAAAMQMIFDQ